MLDLVWFCFVVLGGFWCRLCVLACALIYGFLVCVLWHAMACGDWWWLVVCFLWLGRRRFLLFAVVVFWCGFYSLFGGLGFAGYCGFWLVGLVGWWLVGGLAWHFVFVWGGSFGWLLLDFGGFALLDGLVSSCF